MTQDLLNFLDSSTCCFTAVRNVRKRLDDAGFKHLDMRDKWPAMHPGEKYYIIKNHSAIFPFITGSDPAAGYKIIAAHSDSPGFKVKPSPEMVGKGNIVRLNTEVYGGPILYTWFDRPLSLAGRVVLRSDNPLEPKTVIIDLERPILEIPHLSIHFNRAVNEGNPLSRQKDMMPVLGFLKDGMEKDGLLLRVVAEHIGCLPEEILDFDLCLYPVEKGSVFGLDNEFISSPRIDDLEMVHCGLTALLDSATSDEIQPMTRVLAVFDNEETGSGTKQGAASPILRTLLTRINHCLGADNETFFRAVASSFMISADNGHGLHPNYEEKQDPTNLPILGKGPVIKSNANCKYMTDADSAAVFRRICQKAGVPVQTFVNHSDVAGGSTLGNILTSQLDLRGVDMGCPQWAMHSCRETASVADQLYTLRAFTTFYNM